MKLKDLMNERRVLLKKVALAEYMKSRFDELSSSGGVTTEDAGEVDGETILEFLADIDAYLVNPMLQRIESIEGIEVSDVKEKSDTKGKAKRAKKGRESKKDSRKT